MDSIEYKPLKLRLLELFFGKEKANIIISLDSNKLAKANEQAEFPVVLTVKYFHSGNRQIRQIFEDFNSWGNKAISIPILRKYEDMNRLSPLSEFNHYQYFSETLLFFKDEESCHQFCQEMGNSGAVNRQIQRQLGYTVEHSITRPTSTKKFLKNLS